MWVLGLNGRPVAYHDASACLVSGDGHVVAIAEEERFTRVKHGIQVPPTHAVELCLSTAGLAPEDVDVVAVGWDVARLRRMLGLRWFEDEGAALVRELVGPDLASRMRARLELVPHHEAHAAMAFYASGFPEAAVLVVDGRGEDSSTSIYHANHHQGLRSIHMWPPRSSLGFLYEAATEWLGFGFLNAGKTMALASFGRDRALQVETVLALEGDELVPRTRMPNPVDDKAVVDHWKRIFTELAGRHRPTAQGNDLVNDAAAVQVAWTAQRTVERVVVDLAALTRRAVGTDALCIGGGVGLNCVANGMVAEPVYVPPAPNDAGVALGAAWSVCPPTARTQLRADLGLPIDSAGRVTAARDDASVTVRECDVSTVVDRLAAGQVGAVVEGRAELGPRALGRRSIVALPTPASVADRLNLTKGRELWRPFAPVALQHCAKRWWAPRAHLARYMTGAVSMTNEGTAIAPAVRHVDGTTRPQEVARDDPLLISEILVAMERAGIPPLLVNTSFNGPGEPIVNNASDAIVAFMKMDLDFLVVGGLLVSKSASP